MTESVSTGLVPEAYLEVGRLHINDGNWLGPDQEAIEEIVIPVPFDQRSVLRVDAHIDITKGDRLVHAKSLCRPTQDACERGRWRIVEDGRVNSWLREDRYMLLRWYSEPVTLIDSPTQQTRNTRLDACISRAPTRCSDNTVGGLAKVYGQVEVGATSEVLVEP